MSKNSSDPSPFPPVRIQGPVSDFDGKYTEVILDMDNDIETRNAVHAGVNILQKLMQNSKYHHRRGVYLCMLDSRCGYRA